MADYVGLGGLKKSRRLDHPEALAQFLRARASHVAQTALYGYLKTRAGTRFPEMFENPGLLRSMNMAKWQIWLACLSDLTIYTGGLLAARTAAENAQIQALLTDIIDGILADAGVPAEAADEFPAAAAALRVRIANADHRATPDDETPFRESPEALWRWAPIADELKKRDREIVLNSVRFRWLEVRRETRELLDAEAVMGGLRSEG